MTNGLESLEQLVILRDKLLETIRDLEMGLFVEKKKIDEYDFYRNDPQYDRDAMDAQAERSRENVRQIKLALVTERNKYKSIEARIVDSKKLVTLHGSHPCLTGAVPHEWDVLARHGSGKFRHRKCRVCGTDEKVGQS